MAPGDRGPRLLGHPVSLNWSTQADQNLSRVFAEMNQLILKSTCRRREPGTTKQLGAEWRSWGTPPPGFTADEDSARGGRDRLE